MRYRIDRQTEDPRAPIRGRAGEDAIRPPVEAECRAGRGDPNLISRPTESNSGDATLEDALYACGGDALTGRDHARVGNVSPRRGERGLCLEKGNEGEVH